MNMQMVICNHNSHETSLKGETQTK